MLEKEITIENKSGLHARPAALFVQLANKYESNIIIKKNNLEVNGKSIMGILMLAVDKGSKIKLQINGSDEKEAMQELETFLVTS
jgi:phosphocarrier protein